MIRKPRSIATTAPYLPVAAYLATIGWAGLTRGGITPGDLLDHALPGWLVLMWTIAVAAGGTAATLAGLTGRTRVESAGLALLLYGAAVYGVVGSFAVHGNPWQVATLSAAIAAMCLLRMRALSQARHAREVAADIDREADRGQRREG